ncbi:hypothetical protein ID47_06765 [Candidatus Paracaedibacter acanthamoebae]|uniref:Uncharacterized protein n=2 Tax=Candidatus Odyssella acanthamoebae TaxID=91604 RepID=A0A077AXZ3_9PROT|nr:hypothetical protein ID47_06765 [Candidatus Paracaedibacter acanthamoebae]
MVGIFIDATAQDASFSFSHKTYPRSSLKTTPRHEVVQPLSSCPLIPAPIFQHQTAKSPEDFCQTIIDQAKGGKLASIWHSLSLTVQQEIIFYKLIRWAAKDIGLPSSTHDIYFPGLSEESLRNFYIPLNKLLTKGFRKDHSSRSILAQEFNRSIRTFKNKLICGGLNDSHQSKVHFSDNERDSNWPKRGLRKIRGNLQLHQLIQFNRSLSKLSSNRLKESGFSHSTEEQIQDETDYLYNLLFFIKLVHHNDYQSASLNLTAGNQASPFVPYLLRYGLTTAQQILLDPSFNLDLFQMAKWESIFSMLHKWAYKRLAYHSLFDLTTEDYINEMDKLLKFYTFIMKHGANRHKLPIDPTFYTLVFAEMQEWEPLFNQAIASLEFQGLLHNRPNHVLLRTGKSYQQLLTIEMRAIKQTYYSSQDPLKEISDFLFSTEENLLPLMKPFGIKEEIELSSATILSPSETAKDVALPTTSIALRTEQTASGLLKINLFNSDFSSGSLPKAASRKRPASQMIAGS